MAEHRTVDTGEPAPHPGMTSGDLREFEAWADEADRTSLAAVGAVAALVAAVSAAMALAGLLA